MGQFDIIVSDELNKLIAKHLADLDKVAPKMLDEAAKIVEAEVIRRAPVETGAMQKHISHTKPKQTKTGAYISGVTFKGTTTVGKKNRRTVRNMEKAAWIEYGTSFRQAKPFIRPAIAATQAEAATKMAEVFNEEMEGTP